MIDRSMVGSSGKKTLRSFLLLLRGGRADEASGPPLGILAFEAARTMSRLCSLHRALSDRDLHVLRACTARSTAVARLVSLDQLRLLRLACAELALDLDSAADFVSRLALRCRSPWLRAFPHVYADLRASGLALPDRRFVVPPRDVERRMSRLDRYAAGAAELHGQMEALEELEASERELRGWRDYSGPITRAAPPPAKQLAAQRRLVRRLQKQSLWSVGVEKATGLMARAVVTVFLRLCAAFAAHVPELPMTDPARARHPRVHPNRLRQAASGPLAAPQRAPQPGRSGPLPAAGGKDAEGWAAREMAPADGTVGAAGLALRYANVVAVVEGIAHLPEMIGEEARAELYAMLPDSLRALVSARRREIDGGAEAAARGGEDARRVLAWLGPMAEDTSRWHAERSCERQKVDSGVPTSRVLAMQTLLFANKDLTEKAIGDVLVGLSCVISHFETRDLDRSPLLENQKPQKEEEDDVFWQTA